MKRGLRGQFLPESWEDFKELVATGFAGYRHCVTCHEDFAQGNVFTSAGWRETQLGGMCERCFDTLFSDGEGEADASSPHQ